MPTNQKIILENDIILSKTEKHPIVNVGGITTEDNIANMTVKDILNEMLFPYIAPEIKSFSFYSGWQYKNANDKDEGQLENKHGNGSTFISDFYLYEASIDIDGHGNEYSYKLWVRNSKPNETPPTESTGKNVIIYDSDSSQKIFNLNIANSPASDSLAFKYNVLLNETSKGSLTLANNANVIYFDLWLYDNTEKAIAHSYLSFTITDQYIYGSIPVNDKYITSEYQACSGKQGTFNTRVNIPAFDKESYMFFAIPKSKMSSAKNSITMVADQGQFEQTWNLLNKDGNAFNLKIHKYINTTHYRVRDYYVYLSNPVNKSETVVGFTYKS